MHENVFEMFSSFFLSKILSVSRIVQKILKVAFYARKTLCFWKLLGALRFEKLRGKSHIVSPLLLRGAILHTSPASQTSSLGNPS